MYIYVSINLVAVDPKWKKKKKPTPQPCHSTIYSNSNYGIKTQKRKEIKNGDSCPQIIVTWRGVTSLEPEQASVSRLEGLGADRGGSMWQEMCFLRWTWRTSSYLHEHPISISRWAHLQRNHTYFTPKMVESRGWKSFSRSPGHHMSCRLDFPTPVSVLKAAPLTDDSIL